MRPGYAARKARWLLSAILGAGCYQPVDGVLCHFLDPACAEADMDGDGLPNHLDPCPADPDRARECGPGCRACAGAASYCSPEGRCVDDCAGRECGPSPQLEHLCGSCPGATEYCDADGRCVDDCAEIVCGPSLTQGFVCGECDFGGFCREGACLSTGVEPIGLEGGGFWMGSDAGPQNARPAHLVRVPSFRIGRTEVTVAQYRGCVEELACNLPGSGAGCNWNEEGRDEYPINCVSWGQARFFCAWAGGRLPSEAEWEYAARSRGKDTVFPWGDAAPTCDLAVMSQSGAGCGEGRPWPVCSKPDGHSEQGLCDLSGNVEEWVQDRYHSSYLDAPGDGTAWEEESGQCSTGTGDCRVVRGGHFDAGVFLEARARWSWLASEDVRSDARGFRCAAPP